MPNIRGIYFMKKIVMIGKMNDMTKDIHDFLGKYFRMQLCMENPQNALGMVKVIEPDLVLISLVGLFDVNTVIFGRLQKEFPQMKFYYVGGECDYGHHKMLEVIEAGGYKILCVHGHEHNVQGTLDALIGEAKQHGCKVALYGHTHMYRTECIDGVYIMNPGAIDSPRGKNKPSYGVITIDSTGKLMMNIVAVQ